jgi:hypothetical protein
MKTKTYKVYKFKELDEETKQKAIENLYDINVDYEWWQFIYEDAERIGIKIVEFDVDRNSMCKIELHKDMLEVIELITKNHGDSCDTFKTARQFKANYDSLNVERENYEEAYEELEIEFKYAISEDYRIMLQKEYEYLTSEEAIIESIELNDYDFTEDGKID